jgi:hypothetical protein
MLKIGLDQVLSQMSNEIGKIRVNQDDVMKVREHMASIRTLCDLVLGSDQEQPIHNMNNQLFESAKIISQPFSAKGSNEPITENNKGGSLLDF